MLLWYFFSEKDFKVDQGCFPQTYSFFFEKLLFGAW